MLMVPTYLDITLRDIKIPINFSKLGINPEQLRRIQFSQPLKEKEYIWLSTFLRDYPNIVLRIYGNYSGDIQDLEFLKYFPEHKQIAIDLYEIGDISGLGYLSSELEYLGLGQTRKRFSLRFLEKFFNLKQLYLEGHTKDIDSISALNNLREITLRSITLPNLELLLPLKYLKYFDLKLGGTKELRLLPEIGQIEYLELWMVRGLEDISFITDMTHLRYLFLESLKKVSHLPSLKNLPQLQRLQLVNMKGIRDLSHLLEAKSLRYLEVYEASHMKPEDFYGLKDHAALEYLSFGLGSDKKNNKVREVLGLPAVTLSKGGNI